MITLSIPDMSCGHCKASVEAAVIKLDPAASVTVDLTSRKASITTNQPIEALISALDAVGFPATAA